MARKYYVQYFTTPNDTNEHVFDLKTRDNFQQQQFKEIYLGQATAGVEFRVYEASTQKTSVDLSRFQAGNDPLEVDFTIAAQIPPQVSIIDHNGVGVTALPVIVGYEVPGQ